MAKVKKANNTENRESDTNTKMTLTEEIIIPLTEDEVQRVRALGKALNITGEELLNYIFRTGIDTAQTEL